jgi:hypothetical protein
MQKSIVFALIAIVIGVMLLSGCTTPGMKKDGKTVLISALQKSKTITSSESAYDANIAASGLTINLKTGLWMKGNVSRSDLTGSLLGIPLVVRYYTLEEGSYSCAQSDEEWTCKAGEEDSVTGLAKPVSMEGEDEQTILEMVTKGALVIQSEVTEGTYAGRKCDTVNMEIDATKLADIQSNSELIDTANSMRESNVSKIDMVQCLDQETGYPLYFKMSMNISSALGGSQEMVFEMTATKYIPNPSISSDIFVLPAEVE